MHVGGSTAALTLEINRRHKSFYKYFSSHFIMFVMREERNVDTSGESSHSRGTRGASSHTGRVNC